MSQSEMAQLRETIGNFLGLEAALLDSGAFAEWYELLDDALEYEVSITQAHAKRQEEVPAGVYRVRDTRKMIATRIERTNTGTGFAELPQSRTVRAVSSLYIQGVDGDVVQATNVLTVYRHRGTDASGDTIFARRHDRYRMTEGGPRLLSRKVVMVESVMTTPNLGIFL